MIRARAYALCLVVALLAALPVQADPLPALFDVTGVAADDVLNIRAAPSASAAIVGHLPPDAKGVEVVAAPSPGWGQVNTAEGTGFVALRYLHPKDRAPWYALQSRLICRGTEPFWSLTYRPKSPNLAFDTPDSHETAAILRLWPANEWPRRAAIGFDGGRFLMLDASTCSDGMSDRVYGIAATLYALTGPDPSALSGCCSLLP